MPNTASIRAKQRFSGKPAWLPGSNQSGRIGIPAGPIAGIRARPATNRGIAATSVDSSSSGGIINRRTNTIVMENGVKKDTQNLVVVQNQLSRGGGPQPTSGMFGVTADGVRNARYYLLRVNTI